ncbi:hypothetical protein ABK040_002147 [Willaertia magna]
MKKITEGKKLVVLITGATGTGKSKVGIELAKRINGEIINIDSVQMFKECNIGSNKVTEKEMEGIPHHMLGHLSLEYYAKHKDKVYSVHDFYEEAHQITSDIIKRNITPICVGGSPFYAQTYIQGTFASVATPKSIDVRKEKEKELVKDSAYWDKIYEELKQLDPDYAKIIHRNDIYRLNKAYQLVKTTGKKMKEFLNNNRSNNEQVTSNLDIRSVILYLDRYKLYTRLEKRCEEILQNGFVDEVIYLLRKGILAEHTSPYKAIGYFQTAEFINKLSKEFDIGTVKANTHVRSKKDFVYKLFHRYLSDFKTATRNYAKHQNTWFKKSQAYWIDIEEYLNKYKNGIEVPIVDHLIENVVNPTCEEYLQKLQSESQLEIKNKNQAIVEALQSTRVR